MLDQSVKLGNPPWWLTLGVSLHWLWWPLGAGQETKGLNCREGRVRLSLQGSESLKQVVQSLQGGLNSRSSSHHPPARLSGSCAVPEKWIEWPLEVSCQPCFVIQSCTFEEKLFFVGGSNYIKLYCRHCPQDTLKAQSGCGLQQGWVRGENDEGGPVAEPFSSIPWASHQGCLGELGRQQRWGEMCFTSLLWWFVGFEITSQGRVLSHWNHHHWKISYP